MHRRPFFKKNFSKAVLNEGVYVCRQCHDGIHRFYNEMELAKQLNTLALLKTDDKLKDYFDWVGKQKIRIGPT